ncbi:MAG: hypothetical protein AB7O79_12405 [Xanthobacteraceae bacterium]
MAALEDRTTRTAEQMEGAQVSIGPMGEDAQSKAWTSPSMIFFERTPSAEAPLRSNKTPDIYATNPIESRIPMIDLNTHKLQLQI